MTYAGIERKRFAQLLQLGTDDEELRRFFVDSRVQLILNGAKVQNLPHGKSNRIRVLTQDLPSATDKVMQKWFSENLTTLDREPISDAVDQLRLYEELGECPPEDEARRLARTCLVHLFSPVPSSELMEFLKPARAEPPSEQPAEGEIVSLPGDGDNAGALSVPLASALIALEEGRDPDEQLSALPAEVAALIAGLYAIRNGKEADVQLALDSMQAQPKAHELLSAYAIRRTKSRVRVTEVPAGLRIVKLAEADDSIQLGLNQDEILAMCTRDYPETQVFLEPLALRVGTSWLSLSKTEVREKIFWASGNVMAFPGRQYPRQPHRGEFGIWRVAENEFARPTDRTNFHIVSDMTPVYKVHLIPFASTDYDNVRGFIKDQAVTNGSEKIRRTLFLLRDDLIVGCAHGKDMSQDESFDTGLHCWRTLQAFRFGGQLLVPGPLPSAEIYECEPLASSVRKLVTIDRTTTDRLTRAQSKRLQELISSGEARLNAARADRLRAELQLIDEYEEAKAMLLDAVMQQPKISEDVSRRVQDRVDELVAEREDLRKSIEEQKRQLVAAIEERKRVEKEQRAMAPAVAKAIRTAFDRAQRDAIGTLGEVAVFRALIDQTTERSMPSLTNGAPNSPQSVGIPRIEALRRPAAPHGASVAEALQRLGITPKWAAALQIVGELAKASGLVLLVDGFAARLAAEAWSGEASDAGEIVECQIGLTDDSLIRDLLIREISGVAILDANLSPLDVYARPLIDAVQRRIVQSSDQTLGTSVVMSLSRSLAALPVPAVVQSVALRVELDHIPTFLGDADIRERMDEFAESDAPVGWFSQLWRPAATRVLSRLRAMSSDEAALAISVLDQGQSDR